MTFDELATLIDGAGRPMPTTADLQSFEAVLGLQFPDAYRAFLLTTPGGIIRGKTDCLFEGENTGTTQLVFFSGLTALDMNSLGERFRTAADFLTPEDALAIGSDPAGNDVVIVLRADRMGEILLLDHEMADYGGRMTIEAAEASGYARHLAGSFSDLVSGCKPVQAY